MEHSPEHWADAGQEEPVGPNRDPRPILAIFCFHKKEDVRRKSTIRGEEAPPVGLQDRHLDPLSLLLGVGPGFNLGLASKKRLISLFSAAVQNNCELYFNLVRMGLYWPDSCASSALSAWCPMTKVKNCRINK